MKRYISSSVPVFALAFGLLGSSWAGSFDWPQWRGPDRADVSKESGLLKEWPAGGPKRVWLFKNAGNGYSGPAIVNGKMFTMGTSDGAEILITMNANTGEDIWSTTIGPVVSVDR